MTDFLIKALIRFSTFVMNAAEYVRNKAIEAQDRAEKAETKRVNDASRLATHRKAAAKKAAEQAVANAEAAYVRETMQSHARKQKAKERKEALAKL